METTGLEHAEKKHRLDETAVKAESDGLGAVAKKKKKAGSKKTAAAKKKVAKKRARVRAVSEEPVEDAPAVPEPAEVKPEEPQEIEEPRTPKAEDDAEPDQQPDSGRIKTRARAKSRHLEINMAKAIETLTTARKRRRRRVIEPDAVADVVGPSEKLLTRLAQAEDDSPETQSPKDAEQESVPVPEPVPEPVSEPVPEPTEAQEPPAPQETTAAMSAPSTLESGDAGAAAAETTPQEPPSVSPAPSTEPETATATSEEPAPTEQGPTDAQLIATAKPQETESAEATMTEAATTESETATDVVESASAKTEEESVPMVTEEQKEDAVKVLTSEEVSVASETAGVKRARDEDTTPAAVPAATAAAATTEETVAAAPVRIIKRRRELTPEEKALQDPWHPRPGEVVLPGTYSYELYPENPIRSIWHLLAPNSDPRLQPHPEGVPPAPWRTMPPPAPQQRLRPRRQLTEQEREWDRQAKRLPLSRNPYLLAYLRAQHPVPQRDPVAPLRWCTLLFLCGTFVLFVWMLCTTFFFTSSE